MPPKERQEVPKSVVNILGRTAKMYVPADQSHPTVFGAFGTQGGTNEIKMPEVLTAARRAGVPVDEEVDDAESMISDPDAPPAHIGIWMWELRNVGVLAAEVAGYEMEGLTDRECGKVKLVKKGEPNPEKGANYAELVERLGEYMNTTPGNIMLVRHNDLMEVIGYVGYLHRERRARMGL